jgi:hypothetical protein
MKKKLTDTMPQKINEYIKTYYQEDLISNIEILQGENGMATYDIDISGDSSVYHLKFNSSGVLIEKITEPLFDFHPTSNQNFI